MTKAELIKALEDWPDDTIINVPSIDYEGDVVPAEIVEIDNHGIYGGVAEATILGFQVAKAPLNS